MSLLTASAPWKALEAHHASVRDLHMRTLFAEDAQRFHKFSIRFGDILFDYSKNRITEETLRLLFALARFADVEGWRDRMFHGE
jgi:glucose-6-phosphate isomerase